MIQVVPKPRDAAEIVRMIHVLRVTELSETRVTFHAMRGTITDNGEVACVVAVKDYERVPHTKPFGKEDYKGRGVLLDERIRSVAAFFNVSHASLVRVTRAWLKRNGYDN